MLSKNSGLAARVLSLVALAILILAYTNCSAVNFQGASASKKTGSLGVPAPTPSGKKVVESDIIDNPLTYPKVDILFVVDESSSMATIVENVRAGFASLNAGIFPADTKMAVTNMAPAHRNSDGSIDFSKAAIWEISTSTKSRPIPQFPGFARLVNKASIDSYLGLVPAAQDKFPIVGCAQEWFSPMDRNSAGKPCLDAATQIALIGTGIEAGAVALHLLPKRLSQSGKKLFRDGAVANVFFVSDTHDPGNAYYGLAGAYAKMPTYNELFSAIRANNSKVAGVKFHGIVPLPLAGDPKLNGVHVIGALPTVSQVSSELTHDFSYLSLIKESNGTAMHPLQPNWLPALEEAVRTTGEAKDLVITLDQPASKILSLLVAGHPIANYQLLDDKKTIVVPKNPAWPLRVDVRIEYETP